MRRRSSSDSRSDYVREKDKRRKLWMLQQERERDHEKLKQKKIEEYERNRAELLKLSRLNLSEEDTISSSGVSRTGTGSVGREERKVSTSSMTAKEANDSEENTDKEKLIQSQESEVQEYRTIEITANKGTRAKESHLERRSVSLNFRNQRSFSQTSSYGSHISHRSRRDEYSRRDVDDYYERDRRGSRHSSRPRDDSRDKIKKRRRSSRGRSRTRGRKSSRGRSHSSGRHTSRGRSNSRTSRSSRGRSHSREHRRSQRNCSSRRGRNPTYRGRSRDRSRDHRDERRFPRDWSRLPYPYIGPIPYPAYYGSISPGPMMFESHMMPPIRGPLPMPLMQAPYPPRFIPPYAYRGPFP